MKNLQVVRCMYRNKNAFCTVLGNTLYFYAFRYIKKYNQTKGCSNK